MYVLTQGRPPQVFVVVSRSISRQRQSYQPGCAKLRVGSDSRRRMVANKTCYSGNIGITFLCRGQKFVLAANQTVGGAMQQIADWLEKLGLGQYALRFAENGIDLSVLPELTDQDFDRLGVLLGHRRKMLRVSAELNQAELVAEPAPRHYARAPPPTLIVRPL